MVSSGGCFLSLLFTLAAASGPIADGEYDYIIVGGGTSGLTVANRLSENPNVNVIVIEAGASVLNNSNVTDVDGYGLAFGTAIDWQYESVNQIYGGNSSQVLRAGKALSGTSTINGMAYTRAEDVQIDAWQAVGNNGWTWESLFPYYLKAENLTIPTVSEVELGATYNPAYHSETGLLDVAFTKMVNGTLLSLLNGTFQNLGVPWSEDVNGGKMRGLSVCPSTVNYQEYVREDAARAYYWPYASRGNLHVLLNTFVNHIELDRTASNNNVTASGVQVTYQNGTVGVIKARREVILSAGSLKSPGILELSGIGNRRVLEKYNVTVLVDLPSVGENLQDQMNTDLSGATTHKVTGHTALVYANVQDIFGNETEAISTLVRNSLKDYASDTAKANGGVMSADDLEDLFRVQYDLIFKDEVPIAEILYYPGSGNSLMTEYWGLLPFSRGSVHIASSNPLIKPTINPNYFMLDWDNKLQIGIAKLIRRSYETYPLRNLVKAESSPGLKTIPQNASDAEWREWIVRHYRSNFHPVGTAAMMPREKGGVVSEHLIVYGTTNVRVIDASVLPFQVDGHLVSTLYAIAERAADFIKQS